MGMGIGGGGDEDWATQWGNEGAGHEEDSVFQIVGEW